MKPTPKVYSNAAALIDELVGQFVALSNLQRPVHISLSGGTTPAMLFRALAETDNASRVQWHNLHFWWGDERCVGPQDADSNYGMTKALLLDKIAIPAANIHRIRGEDAPQAEAERFAAEMLAQLPVEVGNPVFDWILLGIGGDGHTASLFPQQTNYAETALAIVAPHPETGQLRVSKTARVLNAARRISYLALGSGKAEIIQAICTQPANELPYPAAHIRAESGVTEYLIDADAASLIPQGED